MIVRTVSVKSDDRIREVGIKTHTRSQTERHIGEKTHAERTQSSNGGGRGDKIPVDFLLAEQIFRVGSAKIFFPVRCRTTWTCPAAIRRDGGWTLSVIDLRGNQNWRTVDSDDVGHGKKRC